MTELISELVNDYNSIHSLDKHINYVDIENGLKTIFPDKYLINVYDKIGIINFELKNYILNNFYKVYYNGTQRLVNKNVTCIICSKNFSMCSAVNKINESYVHSHCKTIIPRLKHIATEIMLDNSCCSICNYLCYQYQKIVMNDDDFYHYDCYNEKIIQSINKFNCSICSKAISILNGKYTYLCDTLDSSYVIHVKCKKDMSEDDEMRKMKKICICCKLSKCYKCGYYLHSNNLCHSECELIN